MALYNLSFSQDISYSFEGQLDQSSVTKLEKDCASIFGIQSTKVKYKEDAQKGEIIIFLDETNNRRAEADHQFKATDIKKLILNSGLTPIEFRTLKK